MSFHVLLFVKYDFIDLSAYIVGIRSDCAGATAKGLNDGSGFFGLFVVLSSDLVFGLNIGLRC